jgi:uncharacterized protein with FMN-binding domain
MYIRNWLLLVALLCGLNGYVCAEHPEPTGPWQEGTYTGMTTDIPTPQLFVVDVTIANGRIFNIRLRQHPAWTAPKKQEQVIQAVISEQTTDVYKSRHDNSDQDLLLDAIEDALIKAHPQPSATPQKQQ